MGDETKQGRPVWVITPGGNPTNDGTRLESYVLSSVLFGYVGIGYSPYVGDSEWRKIVGDWRDSPQAIDDTEVKRRFDYRERYQSLALYLAQTGDLVWMKSGQDLIWRGKVISDFPLGLQEESREVFGVRSQQDWNRRFVHGSSHATVLRVCWDRPEEIAAIVAASAENLFGSDARSVVDCCFSHARLGDESWSRPVSWQGSGADLNVVRKVLSAVRGREEKLLFDAQRNLVGKMRGKFVEIYGEGTKLGRFSVGWSNGVDAEGRIKGVSFEQERLRAILEGKMPVENESSSASEGSFEPSPIAERLKRVRNLVLEGVPGTGKTFVIKEICARWPLAPHKRLQGNGSGRYAITLHPATSYEDFVEGIRPTPRHTAQAGWSKPVGEATKVSPDTDFEHYFHVQTGSSAAPADVPAFSMQDGFFLRVCAEAVNNPDADFVVLLDEFNRCNVPKVMGDLLTTLERSKRATWNGIAWDLSNAQVVTLPGSKRHFFVPNNVFVLACMNTTDRSVAPLDAALRRRFAFHRLWPEGFEPKTTETNEKEESLPDAETIAERIWGSKKFPPDFKGAVTLWTQVNGALQKTGPDAMLGHSYLYDLAKDLQDLVKDLQGAKGDELVAMVGHHWNDHILPQLAEVLTANNIPWVKFKEQLEKQKAANVIVDRTHKDAVGFLRVPILHFKNSTKTPAKDPSADEQPNEQG